MAGHKSIKRIVHRCMEELDATRRIAQVTSLKEGLETFRAKVDIQIMNRNGYYENESRKKHLLRKHDIMIRYYEKTFGDFLKTYDYNHTNQEFQKNKVFRSYLDLLVAGIGTGTGTSKSMCKFYSEKCRKSQSHCFNR